MKTVLTAMVVVVLTAIYVVGLFLLWDILNVEKSLDDLLATDLYAAEYSPDSSTSVSVTFDGKAVNETEESLLREFFVYWYAGLGAKKAEKIARFYTVQTSYELFDELALDYEVSLAQSCPMDLSFDSCSLTLNVRRRHAVPKTEKVEIDLELSGQINYRSMKAPAVIRGEKHSFVLNVSGKALRIEEHTTDRPSARFAGYGLDKVLAANRLSRNDLNYTFFPKYTAPALQMLREESAAAVLETPDRSLYPAAEYEYNRSAAANSAIKGFANSGAFGEYEENDANFLSRCLFESGIPMDSQGSVTDQWKWYDDEINTERKKTGCSRSWFDRTAFYRYIRDNEGFGLAACQTASGGGEIGDIVQLMYEGEPTAQFMITGIIADSSGSVMDYLVSNDKYASVSLKTLGCTDLRVLHIVGYNTANI